MRFLLVILVAGAIMALVLCIGPQAAAQEKPDKDEEFEDEGADEKELDMLKRAWRRHKEEKEQENPSGTGSEQRNPLEAIAGKMKVVEGKLVREDTSKQTQEKQREILDLLDDLIKKAEEAQQQSSSSQQPQPGQKKQQKPGQEKGQQQKKMTDPSRSNPAQPNSQRQKQILQKINKAEKDRITWRSKGGSLAERWGGLPGHVNPEDVESGSREEFPEKYRELLENYYRQLTKERPSGR
jgi:hypothetical protein